jgi:hypothetical protein
MYLFVFRCSLELQQHHDFKMIDAGSSTAYALTISIDPITQVLAEFYLVAPITGIHYYFLHVT